MTCYYGGKRCVLRADRKDSKLADERRERGREFHIVGAAQENERWPNDDL